MNIKEIDELLKKTDIENLGQVLSSFEADERSGVQKLIVKYKKKIEQLESIRAEWELRMAFDQAFAAHQVLVGIDEVGRGPLAGPVVAAAVILPPQVELLGLKDSKKLNSQKREALYQEIQEAAIAIGIGIVDAPRIDEINILQATFEAMRQALSQIPNDYECVLVDGNKEIPQIMSRQHAIIGGDNKSASIAAASVVAKVTRDRMMDQYAKIYKGYDWESNKGYGSSKHYDAIRSQGITPLHRKSFLKNEGID